MAKKTKVEIEAEVQALEAKKQTVRPTSVFGDNNIGAINAQILVLQGKLDTNTIDDQLAAGIIKENIASAAEEAALWMNGESELDSLAADWPDKK